MFRIVTKHLFWWPVVVRMPDPSKPGAVVEHTFEMQFEALTDDEAREIDEKAGAEDLGVRTKDLIVRIGQGWRDVEDENGLSVPFSPETLRSLSALSWFRSGVLDAYQQAMAGQAARLGN